MVLKLGGHYIYKYSSKNIKTINTNNINIITINNINTIMSLNYFLSYRNKYDQIILCTEEIIRLCDELINESFEYIESTNNEHDKNTQYVLNDIEILNQQKNSHIQEN